MNKLDLHLAQAKEESIRNNYLYATKTTNQTAVQNTFTNVIFDTTVIKGWTYSPGVFTCRKSGICNVNYTCLLSGTNNTEAASIRLTLNSVEVRGSAITKSFVSNGQFTNACLLKVNEGDVLSLQFIGSSGTETISTISSISGETPILSSLKVTLLL